MPFKEKSKVAHLTSVHPAFDIRIFHKECKSLSQAGYHVTLIAPHNRSENCDNIRVEAVPVPEGRIQRTLKTVFHVYKRAVGIDAEIYHFHDPELIIVGLMLKARGKKVIYDVHEDVPRDILDRDYLPCFLLYPIAKIAAVVEFLGGLFLDSIIAVTPGIARRFPKEKVVLVENFPILEEFSQTAKTPFGKRSKTVVYAGNISTLRGALEMITAIDMLSQKNSVELSIAGTFSPVGLRREMEKMAGWEQTRYLGWLNRSQMAELYGSVQAGLILFHPTPNHMESVPNKLFEYMAAGLPVIASDFPKWREIINDIGCGLLIDPLNPAEIASAIEWVLKNPAEAESMGRAGQQAVLSKYNWGNEKVKLLNTYKALSSGKF